MLIHLTSFPFQFRDCTKGITEEVSIVFVWQFKMESTVMLYLKPLFLPLGYRGECSGLDCRCHYKAGTVFSRISSACFIVLAVTKIVSLFFQWTRPKFYADYIRKKIEIARAIGILSPVSPWLFYLCICSHPFHLWTSKIDHWSFLWWSSH